MKKLTIRLDDYVYDHLFILSKEKKCSANKIVGLILKQEIDKPKEMNLLEQFYKKLEIIENRLDYIAKKQQFHFKLSLQHFVNQGYLENANPKESKSYRDFEKRNIDLFNE